MLPIYIYIYYISKHEFEWYIFQVKQKTQSTEKHNSCGDQVVHVNGVDPKMYFLRSFSSRFRLDSEMGRVFLNGKPGCGLHNMSVFGIKRLIFHKGSLICFMFCFKKIMHCHAFNIYICISISMYAIPWGMILFCYYCYYYTPPSFWSVHSVRIGFFELELGCFSNFFSHGLNQLTKNHWLNTVEILLTEEILHHLGCKKTL